jgi:hypothetical protein
MRTNMRAAHAVVVLGILGVLAAAQGGASTDPSPPRPVATTTPDPCPAEFAVEEKCVNQAVTVRFGKNANHPNPGTCDLMDIQPASVAVCPGYSVTWQFVNDCGAKVNAHIGRRRRLFPASTSAILDPIVTGSTNLMPAPYPIPAAAFPGVVTAVVLGTVNRDAACGHYKYDIQFENAVIDPELEVRTGGGR